jgi:hypothetical protein
MLGRFEHAMKTAHLSSIIVAVVFSLSFSPVHADIAERFDGISNSNLVRSSTSVMAWRTVGSFSPSDSIADMMSKRFSKSGAGAAVSSNLVAQLSKILLDERSYMSPEWHDNCIHTPDLVLTFSDGKKSLDVFFCLDCQVVMVKTGEGQPPITTDSLFADGIPQKIILIMKRIFPKDHVIQALH